MHELWKRLFGRTPRPEFVINARPGDVLIFRLDQRFSVDTAQRFRDAMRAHFPEQTIVVLDPTVTLERVLRRS